MRSTSILATCAAATALAAAATSLSHAQHATPPLWETKSPFGAQTVWPVNPDFEFYADRMQDARIEWTRFDLLWWSLAELEPGVFNFTSPNYPGYENWNVDRAINQLVERGIEPFPILCYGSPHYDNQVGPFSDEGRAAFAEYCYQAASRYADTVTYWEIWNEPNLSQFWGRDPDPADYARLVQAAAPRILEANPDAVIVGGAVAGTAIPFLQTAFQHGLLDVVDVITVHPYRIAPPESINGEIQTIRNMIAQHTDRDIRIWTGEWGYNTYWSEMSPLGQAKMLTRMMANNAATGIEVSIWFSSHAFIESPGNPGDPEWGLFDFSLNPRPSYHALAATTERLSPPVRLAGADAPGISLSSPAGTTTRAEWFELPDKGRYVAAVWDEVWPLSDGHAGRQAALTIGGLPERFEIRVIDGLEGETLTVTVQNGNGTATLPDFRVRDYVTWIEVDMLDELAEAWVLF